MLILLKADIKKTLPKNNGRLTQPQIERLCEYKRLVAEQSEQPQG